MANITVPQYPVASMQVKVQVSQGTNQIQRGIGNASALYMADAARISNDTIELAPTQTYASSQGETIDTLVVTTTSPITLNGTNADYQSFVALNIKKLLVLDSPLTDYVLVNDGTSKARVTINAVRRALVTDIGQELWYGAAVPPVSDDGVNNAFVHTLTSVVGFKNRTFTVNAASDQKIYYAYPVVFGYSSFQFGGFVGGFILRNTTTVLTTQGPVSYYVYESDNLGLGSTTINVLDPQ